MDQTSLQELARLLDPLESGRWLHQQLIEYAAPSPSPRVLLLISARRDLPLIWPEGTQADPSWQTWSTDQELSLSVLEQTDLIIWVMTAMRLFPGEYHLALEQSRQMQIPLWAIITGMERLSDESSFLHQRLPDYRASLPAGSQLLLVRPKMRTPLPVALDQLLASEGTQFCQQGHQRRLQTVRQRLKHEIQQERQAITKQLQKAEQYAETAEAGLDSLQDLTAAAATAALAEYQALYPLYEDLKELLLVRAGLEGVHEPLEKLPEIFGAEFDTWQQEDFLPRLRAKQTSAEVSLQAWYRDYLTEVSDFFRFSQSLRSAVLPPEIPWPVDKVSLALQQVEAAILKSLRRFTQTFLYSLQHLALPTTVSSPELTEAEEDEDFPLVDQGQPRQVFSEPAWDRSSQAYDEPVWEGSAQPEEGSISQRTPTSEDQPDRGISRGSIGQKFNRLFERGRRLFFEQVDGSSQDNQQTRKEVLQKLISAHYEWFVDDLQNVLQQQKKLLIQLLREIQQTLGEQHLTHIQPTLTSPQEHLALLTRAERLLRSNE
jgi:hypothetical protein